MEQDKANVLAETKHKKNFCQRKQELYSQIIELSELQDDQLSDCIDKNLELAIEIILKYGSFKDNAKALGLYSRYLSICELLEDNMPLSEGIIIHNK